MPPSRSPPKPPVAPPPELLLWPQLHYNGERNPQRRTPQSPLLQGAAERRHSDAQTETRLQAQQRPSSPRAGNKFPLMNKISRTWDTAYLTPKDVITDLQGDGDTNRVSAYIDVQDTKSFLPTKPFLSIKNKLSKRIENV